MLDVLNIVVAGSAFFLAFLVISVRREANTVANRWLAFFLLCLGLFILDDSLIVFGIYDKSPQLFGYVSIFLFALAPMLYCSVQQFVSVQRRFKPGLLWHFIPALLFTLLNVPYFLFTSVAEKRQLIHAVSLEFSLAEVLLIILTLVYCAVYWYLSLRSLLRHRRVIGRITAATEVVNLDWLRYFVYGVGVMLLVWVIELVFMPLQEKASWAVLFYFLVIYYLGYSALRQWEIFPYQESEALQLVPIMEADSPTVQRRFLLDEAQHSDAKDRLLLLMDTDKPYLDSALTLPALANLMHMSVHELSELVNTGFDENFSQFINRYRVEESKRLLRSEAHRHLSMLGIAYEAGFNSKTAFNTAFKKIAGCAPSVYRDQAI